MRLRACATLLLFLSACATSSPSPKGPAARNQRVANLQRAATLPWADGGRCVVREASNEWAVLVERCYHALDHDRIEFRDVTGRCSVASAGGAALGLGVCILIAPEIVIGAMIVVGVVVVAVAIKEELDAYRRESRERAKPETQTRPSNEQVRLTHRKPNSEPSGQDLFPPVPTTPLERERRPECRPVPVPRASKDGPHNECADKFPPNRYPGMDVSVGGVRFDALQVGVRVLWEIKTHQFDEYNAFVQDMEIKKELKQIKKERNMAVACGYGFVIGVSTQAHKDALLAEDESLNISVTGCPR
ncbi:DUF6310 domain-containing protein [Corallococcus macrosporus]|uniref:DUF6310 domain-containing protein n=1 Tax=Corallococcus macrosporus DSM 14697 TaxID=1189310 RepID=A0A250JVZ9_9BACT|nr:DUF6310 domain-containing protein [Corallococcus macrosporus]ATB48034.1 hypothetical protein MYMAC_003657 [Corallococcus macrosporus DSM 14697]